MRKIGNLLTKLRKKGTIFTDEKRLWHLSENLSDFKARLSEFETFYNCISNANKVGRTFGLCEILCLQFAERFQF